MIYIATNVDKSYYFGKRDDFIKSIIKNNNIGKNLIFKMGFMDDLYGGSIIEVPIDPNRLVSSNRTDIANRKSFICLENGEFVNFYDFQDDAILILCDYDVVLQRHINDAELDLINSLNEIQFGVTLNDYTKQNTLLDEKRSIKAHHSLFDDINPKWKTYNTGIQVARISAWKHLLEEWNKLYKEAYAKCKHHATGQFLFNYIAHKNDIIKEFPMTFHNAHWFHNTPAHIKNNQLRVGSDLVLFNHHKFNYRPSF